MGARRRLGPAPSRTASDSLTIGAVAYLLTTFGDALEIELDDQVQVVQRDFEKEIDGLDARVRRELRRELDARLPRALS